MIIITPIDKDIEAEDGKSYSVSVPETIVIKLPKDAPIGFCFEVFATKGKWKIENNVDDIIRMNTFETYKGYREFQAAKKGKRGKILEREKEEGGYIIAYDIGSCAKIINVEKNYWLIISSHGLVELSF